MARRPSTVSQEPTSGSEEALRKDVASFLSTEIGLGSSATPDDVFDDFAPERAAKQLGDALEDQNTPPKRKKKSTNKFKSTDQADVSPDAGARKKVPDSSITERKWNEGAGQRPGQPHRACRLFLCFLLSFRAKSSPACADY
jgi:hypothetical protein